MKPKLMRAAVFKGNGILRMEMRNVPEVKDGHDVLIKVKTCSICGSDLHVLSVPPGQFAAPETILGHEFMGVVEKVGDQVTQFHVGDRVVAEPNIRCGMCPECRSGNFNLCRNAINTGQTKDGAFAEFCLMPEKQLYHIPDEISDELAALTEPVACVMNGVMKLNPHAFERIVIFGAGPIGLIFYKILRHYGINDLILLETNDRRIDEAKKVGVETIFNPINIDIREKLHNCWGDLADVVIDAVGAGSTFEQALDITCNGARVLIFGQNMSQGAKIKPGIINQKELTICAALSTKNSFTPALRLLQQKTLGIDKLITHTVSLENIEDGFNLMRSKRAIKVIVKV